MLTAAEIANILGIKETHALVRPIQEMLAVVRADEREACARVCDEHVYGPMGEYDYSYDDRKAAADDRAQDIAAAIRARKEKE